MGQTKKNEVRTAILRSARTLFSRHGYIATSLPKIAEGAGTSTANVYVYFRSKLEILYELYDPWLRARIEALASEAATITDRRERLRFVLGSFWRDIPKENSGFGNNIIQAISTMQRGEGYQQVLLRWMEARMQALVLDCLPPARRRLFEGSDLGHFLVMAFDGYLMFHHLDRKRPLDDRTLDALVVSLLGQRALSDPDSAQPSAPRARSARLRQSAPAPASRAASRSARSHR
ncbi:MAG: TetR/AcrR family transcriptional regulator [Betaproteobacteria bacterium]